MYYVFRNVRDARMVSRIAGVIFKWEMGDMRMFSCWTCLAFFFTIRPHHTYGSPKFVDHNFQTGKVVGVNGFPIYQTMIA